MLKIKALKTEIAAAFLTAGMAGASPALAQDTDNGLSVDNSGVESVSTDMSRKWINPDIPEELFYGFVLLAAAGTAYAGYRRTEGTLTRTFALGVGLAAMANPQSVVEEYRMMPTIFPVFVDESMSLGNRAAYVDEAFEKLETRLAALGPTTVLEVPFGDDPDTNAKPGTNLAGTLKATLNTIPRDQLGGAFVISDGVLYDQSRFLDIKNIGAPVHTLVTGYESEQDFHVTLEQAPRIGIAGEDQEIRFRIVDERTPDRDGMRADVDVFYSGEIVTTMNVPVNETQSIMLSEFTEEGLQIGRNLIELEINALQGEGLNDMDHDGDGKPDEVTMLNNRITTTIEGISSEIRVLLLTGEPHAGTRLWRTLLMNDSNVSLTHLGFLRPPVKEDATPLRELATVAFSAKEILGEKIGEFDVIVMDSYKYNSVIPLEYFQNIRKFTEEGGGLLMTGSDSLVAPTSLSKTVLGDIMPFVPTDSTMERTFTPVLTDEGMRHPVGRSLLNDGGEQSWGPWYSLANGTVRGNATTLMTDGNNNPLLTLGQVGEGRVAILSSDQNAIWASGHKGGGPATSLYRSLTGWLTENPRYESENLTLLQDSGEIIIELQTMEDEAEPVIVTTPSGEEIEIIPEQQKPGVFTAHIIADENGAYRARRASDEGTQAYVGKGIEDRTEIESVISDTEVIRPLTNKTGGLTARVVDAEGTVELPQIAAIGDDTVENPDAMRVDMDSKRELIGRDASPMLPWWSYTLAFAGLMMASFREREIVNSLTSGHKNKNNGPSAPSV